MEGSPSRRILLPSEREYHRSVVEKDCSCSLGLEHTLVSITRVGTQRIALL